MAATGELVPLERFRSAKRRQLILGLLLGISISATVAVGAIKYSNRRYDTGPAAVSSASTGQKSGGEALPPVPVSPSAASGSSADIFGSSNHKTGVSGTNKARILAAEAGGHPSPNKWESLASNLPTRAPVQPSLSGKASQKKIPATPQQLWASVQAGNSSAAVALAELYIKGEGVPQNCNQARVLLLVASEKRNAGAIKRLAELDKTGCPPN
jgi:TPR repeat protein